MPARATVDAAAGLGQRRTVAFGGAIVAMTKSDLVRKLAEANPHLYLPDVERIVATVFEHISAALARGDRVELRGFGAFSTRPRSPRLGRNPRTGEEVAVPGKELRERLNVG